MTCRMWIYKWRCVLVIIAILLICYQILYTVPISLSIQPHVELNRCHTERILISFTPITEQFNGQRMHLMDLMKVAKDLGASLILPRAWITVLNNTEIEQRYRDNRDTDAVVIKQHYFPISRFLDIDAISEYLKTPVLEPACINATKLDTLISHQHEAFGYRTPDGTSVYSEVTNTTVQLIYPKYDAAITNQTIGTFIGYFISRGWYSQEVTWTWHDGIFKDDYWEIRRALRFAKPIEEKAASFIDHHIIAPFLAIHWRRGDRYTRGMYSRDTYTKFGPIALAQKINETFMAFPNLRSVFLCTNSGIPSDIDILRKMISVPLITNPYNHSMTIYEQDGAVFEQAVASRSDVFIASGNNLQWLSSYSRIIIEERIIRNHTENTNLYWGQL